MGCEDYPRSLPADHDVWIIVDPAQPAVLPLCHAQEVTDRAVQTEEVVHRDGHHHHHLRSHIGNHPCVYQPELHHHGQ